MQYYSSAVCVLILLITTFTDVSESAVSSVKVNLHDCATLPCSERCSGLVRWTEFSKPTDVLAECDQTSCRSVKEGYQMIHNRYLKGDHSLIITNADYSMRGLYTCECGNSELCDVRLQVEEPEKRLDNKGDNEGPSHDVGQTCVPVWVIALILALLVCLVVGLVCCCRQKKSELKKEINRRLDIMTNELKKEMKEINRRLDIMTNYQVMDEDAEETMPLNSGIQNPDPVQNPGDLTWHTKDIIQRLDSVQNELKKEMKEINRRLDIMTKPGNQTVAETQRTRDDTAENENTYEDAEELGLDELKKEMKEINRRLDIMTKNTYEDAEELGLENRMEHIEGITQSPDAVQNPVHIEEYIQQRPDFLQDPETYMKIVQSGNVIYDDVQIEESSHKAERT